jgi:MFS family permease
VASSNSKVIGLAVAGAVGGFLFGFDSSVVNGAVQAISTDFTLDPALTGFAVAVALLGCAVGAFLAGRLADRFGRVPIMLVGSVLFVASAIGAALAANVSDLILWRVIGGLGIGIASVIAPAYIAEISPAAMRGRLGSLQQLAITPFKCLIFLRLQNGLILPLLQKRFPVALAAFNRPVGIFFPSAHFFCLILQTRVGGNDHGCAPWMGFFQ